ncbi:hypothetical protein [Mesorhizobium sp.]|uniref:hypothetical protein n=1 Tax=Mesorhizobium sp. TaxID=1871066 RepID=UPI0025C1A790|nr:hypothetical protein [Mesorhizobium sp.]
MASVPGVGPRSRAVWTEVLTAPLLIARTALSAVVISFVIATLSPPEPFKQGSKALGKLTVNSEKWPRAQVPSQNLAGKLLSQQPGESFVMTSILGHFHAVLINAKPEAPGLVPLRNRDLSPLAGGSP